MYPSECGRALKYVTCKGKNGCSIIPKRDAEKWQLLQRPNPNILPTILPKAPKILCRRDYNRKGRLFLSYTTSCTFLFLPFCSFFSFFFRFFLPHSFFEAVVPRFFVSTLKLLEMVHTFFSYCIILYCNVLHCIVYFDSPFLKSV